MSADAKPTLSREPPSSSCRTAQSLLPPIQRSKLPLSASIRGVQAPPPSKSLTRCGRIEVVQPEITRRQLLGPGPSAGRPRPQTWRLEPAFLLVAPPGLMPPAPSRTEGSQALRPRPAAAAGFAAKVPAPSTASSPAGRVSARARRLPLLRRGGGWQRPSRFGGDGAHPKLWVRLQSAGPRGGMGHFYSVGESTAGVCCGD